MLNIFHSHGHAKKPGSMCKFFLGCPPKTTHTKENTIYMIAPASKVSYTSFQPSLMLLSSRKKKLLAKNQKLSQNTRAEPLLALQRSKGSGILFVLQAIAPEKLCCSIIRAGKRACWRGCHTRVTRWACVHTSVLCLIATPWIVWSECVVSHSEICRISFNYKRSAIRPGACDHTAAPEIPPSALETSKGGRKGTISTTVCLTDAIEECKK